MIAHLLLAQVIAITGGTIHTAAGEPIRNGTIIILDGRITAVGTEVAIPAGARRIDATGKWITPGFFVLGTQIGLVEIGSVPGTRDGSFGGSDVSASFNPLEGVNPASQLIPIARMAGVTTTMVMPGGGLIAGQSVVLDLLGDHTEAMLVRSPAGLVFQLGEASQGAGGGSRAGVMARLRQLFRDAREYDRRRQDFRRDEMQALAAGPDDLEALLPVLRREQPAWVRASRRADIENALRLAQEFQLNLILVGGEEAWQVADRLATAGVTVVLDPMVDIPSYDAPSPRLDNAALLHRAGVTIVLSNFDTHNARNIRQAAGSAVAYGMPWDAALRAITVNAAMAAGVGDRYGTIEVGRVANVVIWSGDPLDFAAGTDAVFIRGREVPADSRQRELFERYRTLPPRY
ncbi:MAG: amidohydrolase family protein [Gemmatimonadales bacterium]